VSEHGLILPYVIPAQAGIQYYEEAAEASGQWLTPSCSQHSLGLGIAPRAQGVSSFTLVAPQGVTKSDLHRGVCYTR
jgi:hypothetical protein